MGFSAVSESTTDNSMRMKDVRKKIAGLSSENFSDSLGEIEEFLLNQAGASIYTKSMRRIAVKAKSLDVEIPEGYAKEAKATAKKREKQDAFIQTKEEERLAAEAEAAEAEAAEAEATKEEEVEAQPELVE